MPFWFFFTGFAQDPQGNLIGPGFSAISPLIRIKSGDILCLYYVYSFGIFKLLLNTKNVKSFNT